MTMSTTPPRIIRCPACGGPSVYSLDNPARPFCSMRCKNADFGAWASESYRVETNPAAGDDNEAGPTDDGPAPPPH